MPARSRTNRKEDGNPILVTVGRNSVRLYPRPSERGRSPRWMVADYTNGKRQWRTFASEREAREEAARIVARLNALDHHGAGMTGDDRRDLARATGYVAPLGVDVPTACSIVAEAAAFVGFENIVAACKAFARRAPAARTPLPLGKAIVDLLEAKEGKGRSTRLLADLRSRLARFAGDHPGTLLGDFTTATIQHWLDRLTGADGKPLAPQTKRNFATVVGGLFEFHRRRGAIPDNPCADLERDAVNRTEDVEFWTVKEAADLLEAIDPKAKAALVVGLFAGCRTAEVCRLTWGDVDLDRGHVAVGSKAAKTASRRLAPLPENAVAWLRPLAGNPKDRLFQRDPSTLARAVSDACTTAKVRRLANGARHSAITYKVASTGDVARVALDCGNSPAVVHGHYRGLATPEDAKAFFAIMP